MTRLVRGFGDPQSAAKLDVDELLASVAPGSAPAYLVDLLPATSWPTGQPAGRRIVVTSGLWLEYDHPITAVNRVRFVATDPNPDAAWDIATWVHARLLAKPGDVDVHSYRPDDPPRRGKDPDVPDTPITAFTLRVRMRPQVV